MLIRALINQLMNEADAGSPAGGAAPAAPVVPEDNPVDLDPSAAAFEALADEFDSEDDDGFDLPSEEEVIEQVSKIPGEAPKPNPTPTPAPKSVEQPPAVPPTPQPAAESTPPPAQETPKPQAAAAPSPSPEPTPAPTRDESVSRLTELLAIKSEDDVELLRTEPEKVIPKLMANLFYDMHQAFSQMMQQQVPTIVETHQTRASQIKANSDAFFQQWPVLKEHGDLVTRVAKAYRMANPNADRDTAIREIGAMALVQAKIPFDVQTGKLIEQQQELTQIKPPVPAGIGGAAAGTRPASAGLYESIVEEFILEDTEES